MRREARFIHTFLQCQNAQISYERTKGPYNIYVVDPKNPCGDDMCVSFDAGDPLYRPVFALAALKLVNSTALLSPGKSPSLLA